MCIISLSAEILMMFVRLWVVFGEQGRLVEMHFTLTYANAHLWHPAGQSICVCQSEVHFHQPPLFSKDNPEPYKHHQNFSRK